MSELEPAPTSSREALVKDDIATLQKLDDIGFLTVDAAYRPGRIVFRIIGRCPGFFIDRKNQRNEKDRWAFDIVCKRRYPKAAPIVKIESHTALPDDGQVETADQGRPLRRAWNRTRFWGGSWKPPHQFSSLMNRPADCALAYLWTINKDAVAGLMLEHESSFLQEPLLSHAAARVLLQQAKVLRNVEKAVTLDPIDPQGEKPRDSEPSSQSEAPAAEAPESIGEPQTASPPEDTPDPAPKKKKKFFIREEYEPIKIIEMERPQYYNLIPQTQFAGMTDVVFISKPAIQQIFDHISWGHRTATNINEQGGILVGLRCREPDRTEEYVTIISALPAHSESQSSTYVKFDHTAWSDLLHQLDVLKEKGIVEHAATIVGWYHTHPNWLDCFMSGTDRHTQSAVFYRPWNYALVLNPQRKLLACFVGADARPCGAAIID